MDIKPIRTENDYWAALQEIETLMNAQPDSPAEDRLDVLATLVKVYEDEHFAIPQPSPVAALEYYLESRGLTRKALEPFIGSAQRVSEIMNRRRRLTLTMVRRLEAGTGIPASVLIQPYRLATGVSSAEPAGWLARASDPNAEGTIGLRTPPSARSVAQRRVDTLPGAFKAFDDRPMLMSTGHPLLAVIKMTLLRRANSSAFSMRAGKRSRTC